MYSIYQRWRGKWVLVATVPELSERALWALRFYSNKPNHIVIAGRPL